jgi:sarcosine oxidase
MNTSVNGKNKFDVIVIGVGSMGSSACYYLAKQGLSVLGLEQFSVPNEMSSHTGQSRIIRKAYFEHPAYVPLLQRAYKNWTNLENITNEKVYYQTGLLYCGQYGGAMMKGIQTSADKYQIPLENIDGTVLGHHYSAFNIPAGYKTLLEPEAGFIVPEKAISLYTKTAVALGAVIRQQCIVTGWAKTKEGIVVHTNEADFYAAKLVITAGPWTAKILPVLSPVLTVTRQVIVWVDTSDNASFAFGKLPCWIIADDSKPGIFYGFPVLPAGQFEGPAGFKLAWHYPGTITDPDSIDRHVTKSDEEIIVQFLDKFLPGIYTKTIAIKTCMYTNTPDENFIIDFLPGSEKKVLVAAGFSGHGFKFASVVGEILSDLAIYGSTAMPIEFLKAQRFTR